MKHALLVLTLLLSALAHAGDVPKISPKYLPAFKVTYTLKTETIADDSKCSATAVGPHAVLTASHCELPTTDITLDDKPATVVEIMRDDNDHSIFIVKGVTFTHYADVSQGSLQIGDDVFMFGSGDRYEGLLRKGYFAGIYQRLDGVVTLAFDMNIAPGDSGSAIFDMEDDVVGVVSTRYSSDDKAFHTMGCFAMKFTPEQLKKAKGE